jgi:hypothetical protein
MERVIVAGGGVLGTAGKNSRVRACHRRGDIRMTPIATACLDMAGTTVADDGSVVAAFSVAVRQSGLAAGPHRLQDALGVVRETMGQSKIEVFRRILGDETAAQQANGAFEDHYAASVRAGAIAPLPGPWRSSGQPGSRSAWPPGSLRRPGTPCWMRWAGGR